MTGEHAVSLEPPIDVMVSVNDIVTYCLCPRLLYVKKCLGLLPPPSEPMFKGSLVHNAYIDFSLKLGQGIERGLNPEEIASEHLDFWRRRLHEGLISRESYELIESAINFRLKYRPRVPIRAEVKVSSSRLGVSGIIDMIENYEPVEVKLKIKPRIQDYVQLTWYAMLIEGQTGHKVNVGYLDLIPVTRIKVTISKNLRDLAVKLRNETINVIYGLKDPPKRAERPLCRSCELSLECNLLG